MSDETELRAEPERRSRAGLIAFALVVVALVVFVVQNTPDVEVTWLVFDATAPLWLVIIVSAVAGALLSEIAAFAIRRSRRR